MDVSFCNKVGCYWRGDKQEYRDQNLLNRQLSTFHQSCNIDAIKQPPTPNVVALEGA